MTLSPYDLEQRARYVLEAKAASFLDAVFLIYFYSDFEKRWGPPPKPPDIDPSEVFEEFDPLEYEAALQRAHRLRNEAGDVGAAFFNYSSSTRTYEEQVAFFMASNPGFSRQSYGKAVNAGISDMR